MSPKKTAVCIFADKEEIGSEGVSGMLSQAFEWFMGDMCRTQGVALSDCFANSFCLSADVTAAYDPNFAVLSMHAPYETVAKLDCYMTYKCMKAIFEQA